MILTAIMADTKAGNKDVSLSIYKTAPTAVWIVEPQYMFALQESAARAKPRIEYRWMERFYIKGVTEEREIYASEVINEH